jgi:hypothetical protein
VDSQREFLRGREVEEKERKQGKERKNPAY